MTTSHIPRTAIMLGAAGALPFLALSLVGPFLDGGLRGQAALALIAYGAVILSFLGGIQWGFAIAAIPSGSEEGHIIRRLGLGIMPALTGWFAFMMPPTVSLLVLASAFVAMLYIDVVASRNGDAPDWYPRLRVPLTIVVVLLLMTGAFFSLMTGAFA